MMRLSWVVGAPRVPRTRGGFFLAVRSFNGHVWVPVLGMSLMSFWGGRAFFAQSVLGSGTLETLQVPESVSSAVRDFC